jgi:hypothetical protein
MPLFMSVSGYLFYVQMVEQMNNDEFNWEKYSTEGVHFIIKKVKHLIIPLILVKYLWLEPLRYLNGYSSAVCELCLTDVKCDSCRKALYLPESTIKGSNI